MEKETIVNYTRQEYLDLLKTVRTNTQVLKLAKLFRKNGYTFAQDFADAVPISIVFTPEDYCTLVNILGAESSGWLFLHQNSAHRGDLDGIKRNERTGSWEISEKVLDRKKKRTQEKPLNMNFIINSAIKAAHDIARQIQDPPEKEKEQGKGQGGDEETVEER